MTTDPFERELHAMLAARDPGAAPASLSLMVRVRIRDDRGRSPRIWGSLATTAGTVVAAIAAVVIVAVLFGRPPSPGTGASGGPMPSQISGPLQPGDGVVKGLESPAPQVLVAVICIAFLIGVAWRWPTRRLRIVAIVGVVAILAVGWTIGRSDALGFRSGAFAVQPSRADTSGTSGMIVAANADGPFTLLLTLTNTSALPLDLLGLPDSVAVDAVSPYPPRFVGVGILDPKLFDSSSARPLKRVTVAPGEQIDLAFLGRAGPCATATGSSDSGYSLDRVKLAYEQLSLVHVQEVVLPEAVVVPAVFPCPPDSPAP